MQKTQFLRDPTSEASTTLRKPTSFPENFEMHSNAISSFDKFDNSSINSVSREGIVSGKYKPLSKGIPVSTASLKLTFVLLSLVL